MANIKPGTLIGLLGLTASIVGLVRSKMIGGCRDTAGDLLVLGGFGIGLASLLTNKR